LRQRSRSGFPPIQGKFYRIQSKDNNGWKNQGVAVVENGMPHSSFHKAGEYRVEPQMDGRGWFWKGSFVCPGGTGWLSSNRMLLVNMMVGNTLCARSGDGIPEPWLASGGAEGSGEAGGMVGGVGKEVDFAGV